ncbi:MAG: molybdopterin-dependent oxidoreductase [Myxococcota bacterium]
MTRGRGLGRRDLLKLAGVGAGMLAAGARASTSTQVEQPLPAFTGPGPNPYWNSVGPLVTLPEKSPLIQLTDRPVQLETPRHHFLHAFTPASAFFVRWHLDGHPTRVDLATWRLQLDGHVERPQQWSLADLFQRFKPVSVAAVNQCSGNSRSRFEPRIPGAQWGHGAMGCALWTGVRLRDLLSAAGIKRGAVHLQCEGLDRGRGPEGMGSQRYLKSLPVDSEVAQEALVAWSMNGEPLPLLNGFPLRLVVPGHFSTYWVKSLTNIRVLTEEDKNFWMATAYKIPDNPRGHITPEGAKQAFHKVPIGRMPLRSFIIAPDGTQKIPAGMPVTVRGIAFSGRDGVRRVELSADGGQTWQDATLGEDHGNHAFRTWTTAWTPTSPGETELVVRATDKAGSVQTDDPLWNPGGYMMARWDRQKIVVGRSA